MNNECVTRHGRVFRRVSKPQAQKLFDRGETVFILASNLRFDNLWMAPCEIRATEELTLDGAINAYKYYNCNSETGYRVHYYAEIKE